MYYSKNSPTRHGERIVVPENYSGNAFRVKDETDRHSPQAQGTYKKEQPLSSEAIEASVSESVQENTAAPQTEPAQEATARTEEEKSEKKTSFLSSLLPPKTNGGLLSSIFHDIDIEDILVFALLLILYQDDSDDDILLLLLILLFLK